MALSGLDIYKLLPKTNCKECGFPTCLAFAMQLAAKKATLDKCPYVSEDVKKKLESASRPPINLVTIGSGDKRLQIGNETVMFRHEETFYHPTGIGFTLDDSLPDAEFDKRLDSIEGLAFERVGQKIEVNLVALENRSKNKEKFLSALKRVLSKTKLNLILISTSLDVLKSALEISKDKKPLIYTALKENIDKMISLAKESSLPLAIKAESLDELAGLSEKAASSGINDVVLDSGDKPLRKKIEDLTYMRRMALKKSYRPFGYPTITFTNINDPFMEAGGAASLIAKYSSIVIMKNIESWQVLPLLTVRQNIYTDPQKPLQVEPRIYEIGNVKDDSPVLVTTNFSLTYYTVESEVEASKVPSYIISVDSEGMSVLTAWAAEKFTSGKVAATLKGCGIENKLKHKEVIIPGYVAVMSGKLEEESGWHVRVGPREASGIPTFLRGLKK